MDELDMKEKLIKLLYNADERAYWDTSNIEFLGKIADHLIANGVTVQEWISVKDRLPEKNTTILGYYEFGRNLFWYDEKGFNDIDEYGVACPVDSVTHWMPLPEPPKGE